MPPTPEQVRLIARAAIDAGEIAEAHYYMAEYRFMIGDQSFIKNDPDCLLGVVFGSTNTP